MDICIWDKCNNNCLMCTNPDKPWLSADGLFEEGYDYKILTQRIKRLGKRISLDDVLVLTGGEPTLHPDFLNILDFIRQNFTKQEIRILTNGRRFFYPDFTQSVLKVKNLNLAVSLYGPTAKIHDAITRTKGSFDQTIRGLENILNYRKINEQSVEIRTVISKLSYKYLADILKLVRNRFSLTDRLILIFMESEGQANKNSKSVGISYSQIRPYLRIVYPVFKKLKELRLYHFPLCSLDFKLWPFVWRTLPAKEIIFIDSCGQCKYKKYCLGIHRDYPQKTIQEFKPIKEDYFIEESDNPYHPILKVNKK